ncbi:MAG: lysophospholipid acyltransferase family protein [Halofilum sp. (in: g-proteobacteria)]|nr:lysophospholipid acyltransferase family protein [Halofilum sp. (in: g-proteobacteria)]
MRPLRRIVRLALVVPHVLLGLWWAWRRMPAEPPPRTREQWDLVHRWNRRALALVGVRVRVHGRPAEGPTLFVSNHVSWLDIGALSTTIDAAMVGKAELRDWPVLSVLIVRGGTIFIRRGARDAASNAAAEMARRLARGDSAAVFPEGTTTRGGHHMRRFHPRLFEAARATGAKVQPVALVYDHPAAPFVDDQSFGQHLWRILGERLIHVDLHLLEPIETAGRDRRSIAREAETAVRRTVANQPPSREE